MKYIITCVCLATDCAQVVRYRDLGQRDLCSWAPSPSTLCPPGVQTTHSLLAVACQHQKKNLPPGDGELQAVSLLPAWGHFKK